VAREQPFDESAIDRAARTDDDPRGAQSEHLVDVDLSKQAAPHLHLDPSRIEDGADELLVVRASIGPIHIHKMNPARTRARELREGFEGFGRGAMGTRHAPACDVNGGIELHEPVL
jgi:hypothetical protein